MEKLVWTLVLLAAGWSGVAAITVTIPLPQYEYARGDNITLPCTFKSTVANPSQVVISWIALPLVQVDGAIENDIITYFSNNPEPDVGSDYEGRASLDLDLASGKANLKLNSISLNDNRDFECKVQIPKDLKGQPVSKTRLVVLVAPSTPVCKVQGKAEYGQNINITCASAEGSPPPTYSWAGYDVNNRPRAPDPKTTDKGGILSLFNITKDTSGFYICTSANKIRSATCNYTLSVLPPSMNIASTGAIIGGVVAALILFIIIIYCCCCRKKKAAEEEYAMGVHEDEYHDKEPMNGDSRRADGQESAIRVNEQKTERGVDRPKDYEDRRSDYDDRRSDYDDRRSDYNDRRSDYDDRRSDYDRRKDYDDRRSDYDDRRSDYNDRRKDYDDRRSDYDDRRKDYDDRRSDYDDRRKDYDDRRSDYDDRRSDYDDRRNKYGDRRERYDEDRRSDNDRRDPRSDRP